MAQAINGENMKMNKKCNCIRQDYFQSPIKIDAEWYYKRKCLYCNDVWYVKIEIQD